MKGLIVFGSTLAGSYVGWALGSLVGFITACYASVLGMGVGLYFGRRLWQRYERDWS
jgi:hypothetical protein